MQKEIDLNKVVQLTVEDILVGDYIVNLGTVIKKKTTAEFISFIIRGNVLSAAFFWFRKSTTLCCITAVHSLPIGLS